MRELAKAQANSGLYMEVGLGVIADPHWPTLYTVELETSGRPYYIAHTPNMFGTAQFLWQRIQRPPIDAWVEDLLARSGAKHCVLHFHNAWLSGVFLPLRCVAQKRTQVVVTFHGVNGHFRRQPLRKKIHRWMAKRLIKYGARLTSVDHANLSRAQSLLAMSPDNFRVVPNGITDTNLRGCPWLSGRQNFTLGHVGSMTPAKGWHLIVEAVTRLRESGHNINVLLAGRGEDAEQAAKLAAHSGGWLRYEGFVANPRETVFPQVDALVLMSEQEGLPMAIIEALSMGVPVLATSVGGVPEAVIQGKNGLLVKRSVEALMDAIKVLLADHEKMARLSINARHSFEDRFEITRIVSMYDQVYQLRNESVF